MTGKEWIKLIRDNKDSILAQMRPHWRDAVHNHNAGLDILLYLEDDGTVTADTIASGSQSGRIGNRSLRIGSSLGTKPMPGFFEADVIESIIDGNMLHDRDVWP